jgi:hypothetical protein
VQGRSPQPVYPVRNLLDVEPLEERARERTPRLGEQQLPAQPRQQLQELLGVAPLVQEICTEDDIPAPLPEQRLRLVPAHTLGPQRDAVALCVRAQERDGVVRPVGGENLGAADRGRERRQAETRAELENAPAGELEPAEDGGERDAARPELRPVGQELVLVERLLVDELVRARRPQQRQLTARDLDDLLDQSDAKRSTGTPSGSASCA